VQRDECLERDKLQAAGRLCACHMHARLVSRRGRTPVSSSCGGHRYHCARTRSSQRETADQATPCTPAASHARFLASRQLQLASEQNKPLIKHTPCMPAASSAQFPARRQLKAASEQDRPLIKHTPCTPAASRVRFPARRQLQAEQLELVRPLTADPVLRKELAERHPRHRVHARVAAWCVPQQPRQAA